MRVPLDARVWRGSQASRQRSSCLIVLRAVAGSLLGPLARAMTAGQPRILFYHRFGEGSPRAFSPRLFARQLEFLRRNFVPMRLADLQACWDAGEPVPPRAVALTVDDGYRDFAEFAYPQLERFEVPATLYAVSQFSAGAMWLWFDRLRYVCHHARRAQVSLAGPAGPITCLLDTPEARERVWDSIGSLCVTLPTMVRETLLRDFAQAAEVDVPALPTGDFAALSLDDLRRLDAGLVEIGAHTRTHPILSRCTDAEIDEEVRGSRDELASALGRPVEAFCYPNGRSCDFDARTVAAVRAAGFRSSVTSFGMFVGPQPDLYALPRLGAAHAMRTFRHEIDGLTYLQSQLTGGALPETSGEIAGRTTAASLAL